jgi:hypothetical protein
MVKELYTKQVRVISEKEFDNISVAIREDGIAVLNIKVNTEIEVSHVKRIVETLGEIGGGKKYPLLIVSEEFTLPTSEARSYIAKAEADPYASAEAYIIKSFSQKLVGNVYLSLNKPGRPTRLFTDEEKAVEWLKTFL